MRTDAEAQQAGGGGGRPAGPPGPAFVPGAYVKIAPDGKITLYSKNPEIGQGIKTGFGVILAEELDAKWSDVTVEQSPINAAVYGAQFAGGSLSIPMNFDHAAPCWRGRSRHAGGRCGPAVGRARIARSPPPTAW